MEKNMDVHPQEGISEVHESKVAIMGHPIHPILIAMPVTLLPAAFFTDLAGLSRRDPFWFRASRLLLGSGLVTGLLAAATGLVDFLAIPQVRRHKAGWIHFLGNVMALSLTAVNLSLRGRRDARSIPKGGWILSASTLLLLLVTGWYGGELVYRHKIAVTGHGGEGDGG